jgi:hypothetical protein
MTPTRTRPEVKVADEVWIATALLHREHPDRPDFTVNEIVERARREHLTPELRPGVQVHANQHCVANRPPNPGRYLMLVETGPNRRRLYRPGDPSHPDRRDAKSVPSRDEIPAEYLELIDWYATKYSPHRPPTAKQDPLLALTGSGKEIWASEGADKYVRRLREGWE